MASVSASLPASVAWLPVHRGLCAVWYTSVERGLQNKAGRGPGYPQVTAAEYEVPAALLRPLQGEDIQVADRREVMNG